MRSLENTSQGADKDSRIIVARGEPISLRESGKARDDRASAESGGSPAMALTDAAERDGESKFMKRWHSAGR